MPIDGMEHRRAKLRWLLMMIVLVAVAPIFALYFFRLQTNSDTALQHAHERAAVLAEAGVSAHQQITAQARNVLQVIGQLPAVRETQMPECERLLKWVHDGRDWIQGIFVVDSTGQGVCGADPIVRTLNVSDRKYFQDAVATRKFVLSDVITSRVTKTPIVAAALPIYDAKGALQTVVGLTLSLPWINQVAAEASAKFGGILIAVDGKGKVIAYQPNMPADWTLGALSDSSLVKTILSSKSQMFEAPDSSGIDRVFSVAKVPDTGITVAVGLNRSEVLGPIDRRFNADLLFLFLVAAASIAAALLVAEFGLMRGVRALKSAALRLKAGKMGLRVNLPPFVAAELHDLAATYNAMTAEFERLAYLDRLTGLPNRRYLERHLARRDEAGERALPARQAVLAIDIDGFKPVNDSHGHAVGDRVLAIIARRIAAAVDERGILFRVGGDEFVAVVPIPHMQDRDSIRALGEDVRQALEQAIELDGVTFPVACSVGIALVPDDAKTLAGALVVADAALYEAKRGGRNRVIDNAPPIAEEMPAANALERRWSGAGLGAPW
jgi:diguanylate cyclase (GGDEF)-like protein